MSYLVCTLMLLKTRQTRFIILTTFLLLELILSTRGWNKFRQLLSAFLSVKGTPFP